MCNVKYAWNVRAHLYDLATKVVHAIRNLCSLLERCRSAQAQELDNLCERVFLVVPEHDTIMVLHHRIGTWLQTKVSFTRRHAGLVGRTIKGLEDKVERICNGTRHTIAQVRRDGYAIWVVLHRRDIATP